MVSFKGKSFHVNVMKAVSIVNTIKVCWRAGELKHLIFTKAVLYHPGLLVALSTDLQMELPLSSNSKHQSFKYLFQTPLSIFFFS